MRGWKQGEPAARTAGGGGVPARTQFLRLGHRTQKSASVSAPTSTDRKRLREEEFVRKVSVS